MIGKIPKHVVIIPDGNRRWARKRDLAPWLGHRAGAKQFENILEKAQEMGIKCLSFWGSSLDNIKKRPKREVIFLLKIFKDYFEKIATDSRTHKNKVRVNAIGRWQEIFPFPVKKAILKALSATKGYKNHFLNFFLAYDGRDEMLEAIRKISALAKKEGKGIIKEEIVKRSLFTKDLPEVDFLIRTGGEPHLSTGFMMWDMANTQLYFSKKLFPDFGPREFEKAIKEFQKRERRFGG